ncbi:hypothetical protein RJ527_11625 [Thalassospiraceae bacterium LMO-SO8]|nr:hypothetical protein [Alphaproteobacteria bacterium LMO-S08]WND74690.1 hypothetical protein RJ527_11625 [Thalassospiraceae bacterium LMO-SO8]
MAQTVDLPRYQADEFTRQMSDLLKKRHQIEAEIESASAKRGSVPAPLKRRIDFLWEKKSELDRRIQAVHSVASLFSKENTLLNDEKINLKNENFHKGFYKIQTKLYKSRPNGLTGRYLVKEIMNCCYGITQNTARAYLSRYKKLGKIVLSEDGNWKLKE